MIQKIIDAYTGYASYLWNDIVNPSWNSYFYWLLIVSFFFFVLELIKPWRQDQPLFRKDFWLDFFYMFFNFFLFHLIIYNAASYVVVDAFNDAIFWSTGFDLVASNPMSLWPYWAIILTGFVVRDFIQWNVHRLLHRIPFLWQFHKLHHSVEEMGFAAHLRYHWMENVVYRTIEYLPLAMLGIPLHDFFIIHIFSLAVGHYNHSNLSINARWTGGILGLGIGLLFTFGLADLPRLGTGIWSTIIVVFTSGVIGVFIFSKLMKIIFNSPEMHIWHHAKHLPEDKRYGVNFGLTLAIWDFIFKTNYIPYDGKDIELGFPGDEGFPDGFLNQISYGFKKDQ